MSTDLEFRPDCVELRLSPIKVNPNNSSCSDDECKTPTSPGSKIPAVLSCPPAPRKRRTMSRKESIKRKLEFIEMIDFEEIEAFFNLMESQRMNVKRSRRDIGMLRFDLFMCLFVYKYNSMRIGRNGWSFGNDDKAIMETRVIHTAFR
ncbi:hypothetical protein AgCh_003884 [Apium graveolens]